MTKRKYITPRCKVCIVRIESEMLAGSDSKSWVVTDEEVTTQESKSNNVWQIDSDGMKDAWQ